MNFLHKALLIGQCLHDSGIGRENIGYNKLSEFGLYKV